MLVNGGGGNSAHGREAQGVESKGVKESARSLTSAGIARYSLLTRSSIALTLEVNTSRFTLDTCTSCFDRSCCRMNRNTFLRADENSARVKRVCPSFSKYFIRFIFDSQSDSPVLKSHEILSTKNLSIREVFSPFLKFIFLNRTEFPGSDFGLWFCDVTNLCVTTKISIFCFFYFGGQKNEVKLRTRRISRWKRWENFRTVYSWCRCYEVHRKIFRNPRCPRIFSYGQFNLFKVNWMKYSRGIDFHSRQFFHMWRSLTCWAFGKRRWNTNAN